MLSGSPVLSQPSPRGTLTASRGKYHQSSDSIMGQEKNLARITYNGTRSFF